MSNHRTFAPWYAPMIAASLFASGGAFAASPVPAALSPADAVRLATEHSPTLSAALLESKRAALALHGEESRYTPTLTANVDYSHNASPSLNASGVSVGTSDVVSGGVGIYQQFAWGTSVAAELTLSGSSSKYVSPQFPDPVSLGPGYGVGLRLSATQPLLRGAGRTLWEAALRSAEVSVQTARTAEEQAGSGVARAVLSAYWELWYAEQSVLIQRAAKETAERQLSEARAKVDAGALAPFATLPLESSLASIEEQLVAAESNIRVNRVALARLVGASLAADELSTTATAAPAAAELTLGVNDAIAEAKANAAELTALRGAVEQAKLQVAVQAEQEELKLDAGAWLSLQGLGNARVDDAFSQFAELGAVSAGVSLSLELPLDLTTLRDSTAQARIAVQSADERVRDAEEQVAERAAALYQNAEAARARVTLAERTVEVAKRSAEGQAASFAAGAGTALEVVTAQQDQRAAELRVLRARVDFEQARIALLDVMGRLLKALP